MILSTHAIAGTATALIFRRYPVLAVIAAFFSHFVLDAVPHWHYKIFSQERDSSSPLGKRLNFDMRFARDLSRTGFDFGFGLVISLAVSQYFSPGNFWLAAFGAFAGMLPDALQVAYYRFMNFKLLYWFQWFHEWAHSERRLDNELVKGISQQIIVSAIAIAVMIYFG